MMQKIPLLLSLIVLLLPAQCEDMFFGRSQVCVDMGPTTCRQWNTTVQLTYFYYSASYMCFPGNTRVKSKRGAIEIRELKVGDQILAYDFEQGRNVYALVTAWLHRDTDSQVEFTTIKTKGSNAYKASSGHNIAYNKNGSIGFKYADQLEEGDQLISISGRYVVESSNENSYEVGMYSPMTATSNFYVYPFQSVEANDLSGAMILVHCLAQIDNPHKQEHWIYKALHMTGWFGLNSHENAVHEYYLHPITHLIHLFSTPHRKVKYHIATGDQNHLQALPSGGSSSSWGSSSSSWGSSSYWGNSYYPYYGSSSYQQRKQNKKVQLVSLFACLMQVNSVITST